MTVANLIEKIVPYLMITLEFLSKHENMFISPLHETDCHDIIPLIKYPEYVDGYIAACDLCMRSINEAEVYSARLIFRSETQLQNIQRLLNASRKSTDRSKLFEINCPKRKYGIMSYFLILLHHNFPLLMNTAGAKFKLTNFAGFV